MAFDLRNVKVWLNSTFQPTPHPYFLHNCIKQHLQVNHPHMPYPQRETWHKLYAEQLKKGNVVHINHLAFKWVGH